MLRRGPLFVLAAATLWGTTGTAQALGPDGITPATVAFVRMAGGSLLVGYAVVRRLHTPIRSLPVVPLVLATAAMASAQPLFFGGVERTGVAIGTIVTIGSGPLLAGGLAWLVRREPVTPRWYVATALSIAGAVLLVQGGEEAGVDPGGLLLAFGAGLMWAVYLVGAKEVFAAANPVFAAGVVFAGAAMLLSPVLVFSDAAWMATGRGTLVVLWLALVATGFSYIFFSLGLRESPVAVTATLTLAEPLTAAVLGLALLGEPARPTTVAGMLAIVIGLLILARER